MKLNLILAAIIFFTFLMLLMALLNGFHPVPVWAMVAPYVGLIAAVATLLWEAR